MRRSTPTKVMVLLAISASSLILSSPSSFASSCVGGCPDLDFKSPTGAVTDVHVPNLPAHTHQSFSLSSEDQLNTR